MSDEHQDAPAAPADLDEVTGAGESSAPTPRRRTDWSTVVAFAVLPAVALLLAAGAGVLKWQDSSRWAAAAAATESVVAAQDTTAAILSYQAASVDQDLNAARDRLTGSFLESYTTLINTVVIPGAKEKKISTEARVPAASSVSASENHAVALVFVDQTVTVGDGAPTTTASSVRVTLDRVDGRWLVSGFDPV